MKHLESNNILSDYDYQCGFRHSRSCEALLIMLLYDSCYDTGIIQILSSQTLQKHFYSTTPTSVI